MYLPDSIKVALGIEQLRTGKRSLKQSIAVSSVCPNTYYPIVNEQLAEQPLLNYSATSI